jgi:ABC-2 type transport system permease protein
VKRLTSVLTVARWEFMRYFKWKQELLMFGILIGFYALLGFGQAALEIAKRSTEHRVEVLNIAGLPLAFDQDSNLKISRIDPGEEDWSRQKVGLGEIDALVIVRSVDTTELVAHSEPRFMDALKKTLDRARREHKLAEAGVAGADFERWTQPMKIEVSYHEEGRLPATRAEKILVIVFLVMLLSAIMTSFAYFFVSITSEKQARVAEQIVSAIPTQAWIDGKILGISGHGLKSVLYIALFGGLALLALAKFAPELMTKAGGIGGDKLAVGLAFVLLGILFWSAFMAGFAATIDDPNNSARSTVMFIPMLPVILAFPVLDHPELGVVAFLSWFPVTSMAFMPLRHALTDVPWWEVAGSFALLAVLTFYMRRYASRIFRAGMFMYGKEPSWREMWRWMREPDPAR